MKLSKICVLALVVIMANNAQAGYSVKELFLPPGISYVTVTDMNDNKEGAGWVSVPAGTAGLGNIVDTVGLYWDAQGSYYIIDNGGNVRSSKAFAINNKGSVVGELTDLNGTMQGLFRSNKNVLNLIGNFYTYSEAVDINDNDILVGNVLGLNASYPTKSRAFRIDQFNSLTYIDTISVLYPTGNISSIDDSDAYKINNNGRILLNLWGYSVSNPSLYLGPISAILLKHDVSGAEQLRNPTWAPIVLNNNNRMIYGDHTSFNTCFAFDYSTSTGTTTAMPDFHPAGPCTPMSNNEFDKVVGQFEFSPGVKSAFVYDGAMYNLNNQIGSCSQQILLGNAIAINKSGDILASGKYLSDGANVKRAFVLSTVAVGSEQCIRASDVQVTDLEAKLTASSDPVVLGQSVTYYATATNKGPNLTNVNVSGTVTPCTITSLNVNATATCSKVVTVNTMYPATESFSVTSSVFDANGGNNSASFKSNVVAPDLTIAYISALNTNSSNITFNDQIKNAGTYTAGASTTKYYLSSNATYEVTDAYVCSRNIGSLNAGISNPTTGTTSTACAAPNITTGLYYAIAVADSNNQVVEIVDNNVFQSTYTVGIGPDITPASMSASRVSGSTTKVSITDMVKNNGTSNTGAFTVQYYLSKNTGFSTDDLTLLNSTGGACKRTISTLNAGAMEPSVTTTCYKPGTVVAGTSYYVLQVGDSGSVITEYYENNNVRFGSATVKW